MTTWTPVVNQDSDVAAGASIDPAKINLATGTYSIDAAKLTGTVDVARLAGITTSQLATLAGIVSGQIASVASSTLTGTIPATWLGTSGTTAAAGNAVPNAHAASHASGGSDAITGIVASQITSVNPSALTGTGSVPAVGLPAATTSVQGAVILATPSTDVTAGHVLQASDARVSDARTPTAHGSSHEYGGSDPVLYDMGHDNTISISVLEREYGPHDLPTINAGTLYVTYFTAPRALTVNQMILALGSVFSGANYLEVALYTAASDSALTMVRRTGNLSGTAITAQTAPATTASVTGFVTSPGLYPLPLNKDSASSAASNYAITRNSRYAIGIVANATTTVGKFDGIAAATGASLIWFNSGTFGGIANLFSPIMAKQFANAYTAASPIPTSHTAAAGSGSGNRHWALLAG